MREFAAQKRVALRSGNGDRHHRGEIRQRRVTRGQQAMFDVENDFALDEQFVVEHEGILGEIHRSFDRVFDRDEPGIDFTGFNGIENVGDRRKRDTCHCRQIGLSEQSLFGERPRRTEEADASNHRIKATGSLRCMFEYAALHPFNASPESLAAELTRRSAEGWEVVSITTTPEGRYCAFLRRPTTASSTSPTTVTGDAAQASVTVSMSSNAVNPNVPAAWYKDPSGRYELRYWNGTAWTEHVARDGRQFTDPPVA